MPLRKRNRRGRKKAPRKRGYRKRNRYTKIQSVKVRSPGAICGDRTFVKLIYYDQLNSILTNNGNNYAYIRYQPSAAYDVNPSLGTTAMSGFAELAALYNKYRVHASKISVLLSNQEDFGVTAMVLPLNVDPGSSPSITTIQSYQMQPFCTRRVLSSKGGQDKASFKKYMSSKKIIGSNSFKYEENYASAVNTIPADNWYWIIALTTMGGTYFTTKGVVYDVLITCYVEFYDRKSLIV